MIKIFHPGPMPYTPFSSEAVSEFFRDRGIVSSSQPEDCDVFIGRTLHYFVPFKTKFPTKKYLIWTDEPRFQTSFKNRIGGSALMPDVHVMNAYTGDIYLNNYDRFGRVVNQILQTLNLKNFSDFKHKKVAALMIFRNNRQAWSLKQEGKELDLCYLRTQIALEGYKLNKADIYGKKWPEGVSLEDSRDGDWKPRKLEILRNYHFNLCFENTNIDYYCTEKIWDSIKAGCLPIYYGEGNKIYEDFPRNSFLDYCDFENAEDLFAYVDSMSVREFRDRLNLCIETFNKIYAKRQLRMYYENGRFEAGMLLKIVEKIKSIVGSTGSDTTEQGKSLDLVK